MCFATCDVLAICFEPKAIRSAVGPARLSLADWHEQAVGAEEIVFLADLHVLVVVHAIILGLRGIEWVILRLNA
jgi:hypothetical protein